MNKLIRTFMLLAAVIPLAGKAQRTAEVSGTYTYVVSDNDRITLREAKRKCVELAKAEAIKKEFGQLVTSDVIDTNAETNGESVSSYFWENTVAMAKGEWLGDTKEPVINIAYEDGKLIFTAEVCGTVREIIQAQTSIKWDIMKDVHGKKEPTMSFVSGERIYVQLRSPSNGYVAIYLILGENETSCLLPYKHDATGRVPVNSGRDYVFFDKEVDPTASHYKLSTNKGLEYNQVVVIYSPNPFTKCIDNVGDARHPNSLSTREFQKWLLSCQRTDRDMVVLKKWVEIQNHRQGDN